MAVKHPGCTTPVTVKIPKARKRKSNEMEEVNTQILSGFNKQTLLLLSLVVIYKLCYIALLFICTAIRDQNHDLLYI